MLTLDAFRTAADEAGLAPFAAVVQALDGSLDLRIDPESGLYPASMIKVPLALVAYDRIAAGEFTLADTFEVRDVHMTTTDGDSPFVLGYEAPLAELIELAITHSDNVATNVLFDVLDRHRATVIVQQKYGLTHTTFRRKLSGGPPLIVDPGWIPELGRNTHPPIDAARLFAAIELGNVPFAKELKATLGRQHFTTKVAAGFLDGDRFYHKTGSTDEVSHDGGILETAEGNKFAFVLYTGIAGGDERDALFPPFVRAIRPLL